MGDQANQTAKFREYLLLLENAIGILKTKTVGFLLIYGNNFMFFSRLMLSKVQ